MLLSETANVASSSLPTDLHLVFISLGTATMALEVALLIHVVCLKRVKDVSCALCTGYFPSSSDKDQPSGAIVQCLAVVQCILGYRNLDYLYPCLSKLTKLAIFHEFYYNLQDGGHLMM